MDYLIGLWQITLWPSPSSHDLLVPSPRMVPSLPLWPLLTTGPLSFSSTLFILTLAPSWHLPYSLEPILPLPPSFPYGSFLPHMGSSFPHCPVPLPSLPLLGSFFLSWGILSCHSWPLSSQLGPFLPFFSLHSPFRPS